MYADRMVQYIRNTDMMTDSMGLRWEGERGSRLGPIRRKAEGGEAKESFMALKRCVSGHAPCCDERNEALTVGDVHFNSTVLIRSLLLPTWRSKSQSPRGRRM